MSNSIAFDIKSALSVEKLASLDTRTNTHGDNIGVFGHCVRHIGVNVLKTIIFDCTSIKRL